MEAGCHEVGGEGELCLGKAGIQHAQYGFSQHEKTYGAGQADYEGQLHAEAGYILNA